MDGQCTQNILKLNVGNLRVDRRRYVFADGHEGLGAVEEGEQGAEAYERDPLLRTLARLPRRGLARLTSTI